MRTVKVALDESQHIARKDAVPERNDSLASTSAILSKLVFEVGGVNETHTPLSPRSVRRKVKDSGLPDKD